MLRIQSPVPEVVGYTLTDRQEQTVTVLVCRRGEPPIVVTVPFLSVPEPEPVPGHYL